MWELVGGDWNMTGLWRSLWHWLVMFGKSSRRSTMNWLVVWNMNFIFPYIGSFIIPTDELIFQRDRYTRKNRDAHFTSRSCGEWDTTPQWIKTNWSCSIVRIFGTVTWSANTQGAIDVEYPILPNIWQWLGNDSVVISVPYFSCYPALEDSPTSSPLRLSADFGTARLKSQVVGLAPKISNFHCK